MCRRRQGRRERCGDGGGAAGRQGGGGHRVREDRRVHRTEGRDGVPGVGGSSSILDERLRGVSPAAVSRRPRPRPHLPAPGESVCIAEPPPS